MTVRREQCPKCGSSRTALLAPEKGVAGVTNRDYGRSRSPDSPADWACLDCWEKWPSAYSIEEVQRLRLW